MEETFKLPVDYNGTELEFSTQMLSGGYTPKFIVLIDGLEVIYERDEQADFRAILPNATEHRGKIPDRGLLEAINRSIVAITS